jgi:ribonucleoside-triphosphate reductase
VQFQTIFFEVSITRRAQTKQRGRSFTVRRGGDRNRRTKRLSLARERYRCLYTITPTFSICPARHIAGKVDACPRCAAAVEVYSRVVGYLRPVSQWNEGKAEEFRLRKTFKLA